jgi:hypothetical protein
MTPKVKLLIAKNSKEELAGEVITLQIKNAKLQAELERTRLELMRITLAIAEVCGL